MAWGAIGWNFKSELVILNLRIKRKRFQLEGLRTSSFTWRVINSCFDEANGRWTVGLLLC